ASEIQNIFFPCFPPPKTRCKSQFVQFADAFPLKEFGYKPEPIQYLETVGWIELSAGLLMAFGPQLLQEISNFVLTIVMIGKSYAGVGYFPSASSLVPLIYTLMFYLVTNNKHDSIQSCPTSAHDKV
uniref:Transmembrane protein 35B n=1 Tax=Podarcis muralis TaxID=64176 RepID=A0A670IYG4_PODMU